jgi:isopentenyldiphosphate isomerase
MAKIAFVNEKDEIIGTGTKEEAWKNGDIHRIVRILIFNSKKELLIQKRSLKMKIWPGRWDVSVGGHVDEGEDYLLAAKREAKEEMGIRNIELEEVKKYFTDGMREGGKIVKRFNMLYKASCESEIDFDEEEVSEIKWMSLSEIEQKIREKPEEFTESFIEVLNIYKVT